MASMLREGLLLLFRNRPTLAPELLRDALHLDPPDFAEAQQRRSNRAMRDSLSIRFGVGAGLVLSLLGCHVSPEAPPIRRGHSAIQGGVLDPGDPAVGSVSAGSASCTGTLVAPTKVLTAAHCLTQSTNGLFVLGPDFLSGGRVIPFQQVAIHPGFANDDTLDLAVITLDFAVNDVAWVPVLATPLDPSIVGATVTLVGFGATSPNDTQNTQKHRAQVTVAGLEAHDLDFDFPPDGGPAALEGDSGGPALWTMNGAQTIVGVTKGGTGLLGSFNSYQYTRVDIAAAWLASHGVPAPVCGPSLACDAGACLAGTCVEDQVAPCSLLAMYQPDGCPPGTTCRTVFDGGAYGLTCVDATLPRADGGCGNGFLCGNDEVCVGGGDVPNGVCRSSCERWLGGNCPCRPLPGLGLLGFELCDGGGACLTDSDCGGLQPFCDPASSRCRECTGDAGCGAGEHCSLGTCATQPDATCRFSGDCSSLFCDVPQQQCVACRTDEECAPGSTCTNGGCQTTPPVNCDPVAQTGCPSGLACTFSSNLSLVCLAPGDGGAASPCSGSSDCGSGLGCLGGLCVPFCNPGDGAGCGGRGCATSMNGVGICPVCLGSSLTCPHCDLATHFCVQCQADSDCPRGQVCGAGRCLAGCASDADCASPMVCDVSSAVCVSCPGHSGCAGPDAGQAPSPSPQPSGKRGCGCGGRGSPGADLTIAMAGVCFLAARRRRRGLPTRPAPAA